MHAVLPSELLAALAVSLILAGTLFYLSFHPDSEKGLRDWGVGIVLLSLHEVMAAAWLAQEPSAGLLYAVAKLPQIAGAALFLTGSQRFHRLPPALVPAWAAAMVAAAACVLGAVEGLPALAAVLLADGIVAGTLTAGAVILARRQDAAGAAPPRAVAAAVALWALVILAGAVGGDILPVDVRLVVGQVLGNVVAVGLIVVALRRHATLLDEARHRARDSERDAAERAARLRRVLDSLADGMLAVDEAGTVVDFNVAAEGIFGYAAADVIGREASLLLPLRGLARTGGPHPGGLVARQAADPGFWKSCPREDRVGLRSDGSRVPIDLTVSTVTLAGRVLHVALVRDVSQQIMKDRLDAFLHDLDAKSYRLRSSEALGAEVCGDLAEVFEVPLSAVVEKRPDGTLTVRHVFGAKDAPALYEALDILVGGGGPPAPVAASVLADGRPRVIDGMAPPLDRYRWAAVLALPGAEAPRGLVILAGGVRQPDDSCLQQMTTAVSRLATAYQAVADQQQLRLQGTAMAAAANAIFITDISGRIEWVNEAFTRLSGFEAEEVLGRQPSVLRSGLQDEDFYRELWQTVLAGHVWRGELIERRKDGSLYSVEQTVAPILDDEGRVAHFVAVHEDVTSRKEAEQRVAYLANYDMLTRLPNRVLFRDRLYEAVTERRTARAPLAVLFIDLDRFQRVNDTLGHDVGDQLLMTVASRINAAAAADADTIARIGGDEFAIIQTRLPNNEAAASLARKVIDAVRRPVDLDGIEVQVGANVGIAIYPQDGDDPDHLIKNADMAMYRAIRSETEEYFFFSNEMNDEARQRLGLEGDLRRAVENGDLELYYQPQIDVKTRKVVGVEALLRWHHPTQGMIPPTRFIPVAEDSGLILPMGEWVLHEAISQGQRWREAGLPLITMAINISAVQFRQQDLVGHVRRTLDGTGSDASRLELELTESMLMQDAAGAVRILQELSDIGAQLAIDDFGTGYSSLSYLKQFPVDKLKLDQSFVRHLPGDNNDAVIARATINLGHSLGLEVIAEGVETEEQFAYLRAQGCDVVQGYLFGRPVPAADLATMLRAQAAESLVNGG
ncbi:EAL domain-containing protein [Novispirillum sp. DQ9]|uniref:sensor domain-containing protein n=1 Tax=Novispirillum sp. DQ9 TaxID=3398612 RepID=UPI003C7E07E2